jgi:prolipoprotein diacylglyceryltransferase
MGQLLSIPFILVGVYMIMQSKKLQKQWIKNYPDSYRGNF